MEPEPRRGLMFVSLDANRWHDLPGCGAVLMKRMAEQWNLYLDMSLDLALLESPCLERYPLCVFYTFGLSLTPTQEAALLRYVEHGHGLVGIHTAACVVPENRGYMELLGGTFRTHPPHGEFAVTVRDREHPISAGVEDFTIADELYITDHAPDLHVLATATHEGEEHPQAWWRDYGAGRVFYLALGHDVVAVGNPGFLALAGQGMRWAAG